MFSPTTFDDLCRAMQTRAEVLLFKTTRLGGFNEVKPIQGIIQGISVESNDSQAKCWNVKLYNGTYHEIFVRTK